MRTCIIPARGGSKRIPKKNIRLFCGKPMLTYTIESVLSSGCFDQVIVSTDCFETREIAEKNGAVVSGIRPAKLADDHSSIGDVMAYEALQLVGPEVRTELLACVFATNPFLKPDVLRGAVASFESSDSDFLVSICEFESPIQRALRIVGRNRTEMVVQRNMLARSQDFERRYYDAAQFYIALSDTWIDKKPIFGNNTSFVELHPSQVRDIDNEADWEIAELMFSK